MATEDQGQNGDSQQPNADLEARADKWAEVIESAGLDREQVIDLYRSAVAVDSSAEMLADLGPQNEEELDQWFKDRIGVDLPKVAVCPGHSAPFDVACEIHFFRVLRLLLIANRGGAKTSAMAWLDDCAAEHFPGFESFTTGPGLSQGERKYEHLLPFVIEGGVIGGKELPHVARSTLTTTIWKNGSRVQIAPGCLPYRGKIITDQGELEIGRVVEERLPVSVKSYDFDREEWVWARVVDWHNNGKGPDDWMRMKFNFGTSGQSHLTATAGHRVMRPDGSKTCLGELNVGDEVCVPGVKFSEEQEQVLLGSMLGDGCIHNTGSLRIEHAPHQFYYLDWFDDVFSEIGYTRRRPSESQFRRNTEASHYRVCRRFREMREEWYSSGSKRVPEEVWDQLDVLGLAVWLMDDGCFWRNGIRDLGCWYISTHNLNEQERAGAARYFDRMGLDFKWRAVHKAQDQYMLFFDVESSMALSFTVADYIDTSEKQEKGWKHWVADPIEEHSREALLVAHVESLEPARTPRRDRYDITVEGTHNYCVRSGLLISNTVGACNGPRTPRLHRDEIELMREDVYKQAGNIPAGRETPDGRFIPAQIIDTSTMKWAHGRVLRLKEECDLAISEGRKPRSEVRIWCIYECAQEQPDCRSAPDDERKKRLRELGRDPCELCSCHEYTSDYWNEDDDGKQRPRSLEDVCAGRLFRSRGFKPMGDIQTLFLENDRSTWEAEQECSQPSKEGVYIKGYSQVRCGIKNFEPDPDFGTIYQAVDWGGIDHHAVIWAMLLEQEVEVNSYVGDKSKILPVGSIVIFSEIFRSGIGNIDVGKMVVAMEDTWRARWPGWRVHERYPDYQNAAARMDWERHLDLKLTSRIKKNPPEEIKYIRSWVAKGLFFVDISLCQMYDKAIRAWREDNGREARGVESKWSTNPMAATRYLLANLEVIRRKESVAERSYGQHQKLLIDPEEAESNGHEQEFDRRRRKGPEVIGVGGADDSPNRGGGRRLSDSGERRPFQP